MENKFHVVEEKLPLNTLCEVKQCLNDIFLDVLSSYIIEHTIRL